MKMFERLWNKLDGSDPLIRALRSSSDDKLAAAFLQSTIFFLNLPPGCEQGLDPNVSKEELMAHIRKCAQELSRRQAFTPLSVLRENRRTLLLFTQSNFVKPFAQDYCRQVKRLMSFEAVGVTGNAALKLLAGVDSVVFNAGATHEYELSGDRLDMLKRLEPKARAATQGGSAS